MKVNPLYYIPARAQELYSGGEQAKKKYRKVGIDIMGMPFPEGDEVAAKVRRKYRRHLIVAFTFAFIAIAAAIGFALSEEMTQPYAEKVTWGTFGATLACAVVVFAEAFAVVHLQKKIVRHFLKTYRPVCDDDDEAEGLEVYGSALLETEGNREAFFVEDDKPRCDSWFCLCCGKKLTTGDIKDFDADGTALCPRCSGPGVTMLIPYPDFEVKALRYAQKAMGESNNNYK
ncbi:MAG: hypothetical protein J6L99_04675 [Ruminococcus sp.]|nr:hypothetical protein [Ruminococcus sp.]